MWHINAMRTEGWHRFPPHEPSQAVAVSLIFLAGHLIAVHLPELGGIQSRCPLLTQSGHWLSQQLTQFERPGYGTLSFGDQLRLALTHKESSGNES